MESTIADRSTHQEPTGATPQYTLAGSGSLKGVGLHTGKEVTIAFHPAPVDSGIVWHRVDVPGSQPMKPGAEGLLPWVTKTDRATSLGPPEASIQTVEHVMAALAGFGVDNALVEVEGPETPFLDGSAAPFVAFFQELGVVAQQAPKRWRRLRRPVAYHQDDVTLMAWPAPDFSLAYTFVSDHPALGCQFAEFGMDPAADRETYAGRFQKEIAPARTLGWLHEVEALRARGLALGASMESAVVVDKTRLLTPLRLPWEVARHKVLDLLGDLYLLGPVLARIVAIRSGHRHHVAFARAMAAQWVRDGS